MYYFYVIESVKNGKRYKGHTENLSHRIKAHNVGKVTATKTYRPYKIIYNEKYNTREEAIIKEKYYKTYTGGKKLSGIINKL